MEINIIRSARKTVSIRINPNLSITMRVPKRISEREIQRILTEREPWIRKHSEMIKERQARLEGEPSEKLTEKEIRELADRALTYIPARVKYYAEKMGITYGRITIRNQKTRWGSCSSRGNLNFNCLLMLAPPEVIDYVVVHELCHRREMNHSKAFWAEVEKVLPEWKKEREWLKVEGSEVMRRAWDK